MSEKGPWVGLNLLSPDPNRFLGTDLKVSKVNENEKENEKENDII